MKCRKGLIVEAILPAQPGANPPLTPPRRGIPSDSYGFVPLEQVLPRSSPLPGGVGGGFALRVNELHLHMNWSCSRTNDRARQKAAQEGTRRRGRWKRWRVEEKANAARRMRNARQSRCGEAPAIPPGAVPQTRSRTRLTTYGRLPCTSRSCRSPCSRRCRPRGKPAGL